MKSRRLPGGGRIDRNEELRFTWDGRELRGHPGDTLASALLANGVRVIGRSFKYHRPRGVMSAGVEEAGALVTLGEGARRDPNARATTQELYAGLTAAGQNAWPNVRLDFGAASNLFGRFLPAGFYYKTFMGPRLGNRGGTAVWMLCEKFIRRAAGLGAASRLPDPDQYEHAHDFCDVLVIGGGPAGLAAAATAARAGLDVLLVEQDFALGGDLLNQPPAEAQVQLANLLAEARDAGARMMTRTTAFGLYDSGVAGLLERVTDHLADPPSFLPRQRFWQVRARRIVIAAGALERQFAFGDNDRPGVLGAAAARAYLNRYAVLVGRRIVVAANNDSAYRAACELSAAGAQVTLLDARADFGGDGGQLCPLRQLAGQRGVEVRRHCAPLRVVGGGARRIRAVEIAAGAGDTGKNWKRGGRVKCDAVLVSGGWSPAIHLPSMRGIKPQWNAELACFTVAAEAAEKQSIFIAGAAAAVWGERACQLSGQFAGAAAARALGKTRKTVKTAPDVSAPAPGNWHNPIRPLYEVRVPGVKTKALVDPLNDVTAADVRLAHREGFASVEHLKRYTTLGMSADGGKVGNVIGLALLAEAAEATEAEAAQARGDGGEVGDGADNDGATAADANEETTADIAAIGVTTFRPPFTPVALGALRGRSVDAHFRPLRRTPLHQWNLERGAVMTMAGLWQRPWYYPRVGETLEQAYIREAAGVRESVGLCDVTSLGKIAVQGPDAAAFLDRVYANRFARLPVGKARYGIMLRDDGIVLDDGTTWRLTDSDYFMTTTTAHAATVMAWLEELLQVRWPELRAHVASVSEQWAGCAVAGPKSREVLRACVAEPEALGDDSLPFMGVGEITLAGVPCRIARISFSGELAYEVYAPSDYAVAMMDALWGAAESLGGCLYGLEALGTLRIEKGHVTGAELDGRVTLEDAGLGKMAAPDKPFIGSALRARPELQRQDRPRLVGIFPKDRGAKFNAGAILCRADRVSGHGDGWVTAVTHSPALGHWIGLGFIAGGVEAWREKSAVAADPVRAAPVAVDIVPPHMFDPDGERMRG